MTQAQAVDSILMSRDGDLDDSWGTPQPSNSAGSFAWRHAYGRWLLAMDVVIAVLAVGIAQWLRFGALPGSQMVYQALDYPLVSILIVGAWLLMLAIYRTRSPRVIGAGAEEYRRVCNATLSVFGAIAIVSMLFRLDLARGYLAIALPLGLIGMLLGRLMARRVIASNRRRAGKFMTTVLAVGDVQGVRSLAQSLARDSTSGYAVVGACVAGTYGRSELDVPGVGTIPVLGDETDVMNALGNVRADAVALTSTERMGPRGVRALSWDLEKHHVDLLVAPGVVDIAGPRLMMRPVAGLPLIHVEKPQYNGAKRFEKRAFDVVFSSAVLLMALPLILLVAIIVKLTSRGPVFYKSERIGLDGKPFRMVKFRTMVDGADQQLAELADQNDSDGVLFKMRSDPRVTRVGKILRRYSVDEIPQFINVIRRDMSIVGPRPPLSTEVDAYDDEVRRRLLVRPGITGLWQVSGRSDLSWEDSVRLDLFYVENWSMMADLLIAVKTVKVMARGSGAY